jgi:hypothetical protein
LDISKVCNATGVWLEQGQRYVVNVSPDDEWLSDGQEVTSRGITLAELKPGWEKIKAFLYWPLIRNFTKPRFGVFARVGDAGNDEYFLDPDPVPGAKVLDERVIAWPRLWNFFHADNKGTASIEVRRTRQ